MTIKKVHNIAQILGIKINGTEFAEVLKEITNQMQKNQKTVVVTPNPEFLVYAQNHPWFARLLNSADIAIPDGIGLVWAARILGQPLLKRISGSDIAEQLLAKANLHFWQIGIVGARRGEIEGREKLKARLSQKYPRVKFFLLEETKGWQKMPLQIVFACQGMGEQEKWIQDNLQSSRGLVYMGAGGSLDYLSGFVPRAPVWMRRAGLEWLYRLVCQPWRLSRQLNLLKFIWLVLKEKIAP